MRELTRRATLATIGFGTVAVAGEAGAVLASGAIPSAAAAQTAPAPRGFTPQPLPFAPYSGWELFTATDMQRGVRNAANRWRGSERGWAEGDSEALRLALRGRDPFANAAALNAFAELAFTIYSAVTLGEVTAAPVIGSEALPEDSEDEP